MRYLEFLRVDPDTGAADTLEDDKLRQDLQREAARLAVLTDPFCAARKEVDDLIAAGKHDEAIERSKAASEEVKIQQALDDKQILEAVEQAIALHQDEFPLLTKYYLNVN